MRAYRLQLLINYRLCLCSHCMYFLLMLDTLAHVLTLRYQLTQCTDSSCIPIGSSEVYLSGCKSCLQRPVSQQQHAILLCCTAVRVAASYTTGMPSVSGARVLPWPASCLGAYYDWEWDDDYDHHYRPDLRDWSSRCCHLSCTTLTTSQSTALIDSGDDALLSRLLLLCYLSAHSLVSNCC